MAYFAIFDTFVVNWHQKGKISFSEHTQEPIANRRSGYQGRQLFGCGESPTIACAVVQV
jgi:hypothetical protein